MNCKNCSSEKIFKNEDIHKKQLYEYKECGYNIVSEEIEELSRRRQLRECF